MGVHRLANRLAYFLLGVRRGDDAVGGGRAGLDAGGISGVRQSFGERSGDGIDGRIAGEPEAGVDALIAFMTDFAQKNG